MIGQDYPHLDVECVGKSWSRKEIIKPLQPSNVIKRRSCVAKPRKLVPKMYFSFGESMVSLLFIYHEFQLALSGVRDFWLHQEI